MVASPVKGKKEWLLITTSRNPSHSLRRAAKVLNYSIPGSIRINRGSMNFKSVLSFCWRNSLERLIVLNNSSNKGLFEVKAFKLEDEVIDLGAEIRLSEVINVQKHDPSTRIDVRGMKIINERNSESRLLCQQIIDFFSPGQIYYQDSSAELQLGIKVKNLHYVQCCAVQKKITSRLKLFLLTFETIP